MTELLRDNWKFVFAALFLHAALGVLLTASFKSTVRTIEPGQLAIQARVIDQAAIRRVREKERQVEEQRLNKERAEKEAQEREAEEQRQREQEAERQQKAATEKVKQQVEQQKQAQAAVRKQREQADQQRVADVKRKQREQADKKKAEQEKHAQAERENELKQQLAAEEGRTQARNSGLLNEYVAQIQQHVIRNWNRPPSARSGIECEVKVRQAQGGLVLDAQVGKCNGDQAVRQSIQDAVLRASPLPVPTDARLFERDLLIVFKPDE